MSDLEKRLKKLAYRNIDDEGHAEYMLGDGHFKQIIAMVKAECVEAVDNADVISNPRARRNAVKAINQL